LPVPLFTCTERFSGTRIGRIDADFRGFFHGATWIGHGFDGWIMIWTDFFTERQQCGVRAESRTKERRSVFHACASRLRSKYASRNPRKSVKSACIRVPLSRSIYIRMRL